MHNTLQRSSLIQAVFCGLLLRQEVIFTENTAFATQLVAAWSILIICICLLTQLRIPDCSGRTERFGMRRVVSSRKVRSQDIPSATLPSVYQQQQTAPSNKCYRQVSGQKTDPSRCSWNCWARSGSCAWSQGMLELQRHQWHCSRSPSIFQSVWQVLTTLGAALRVAHVARCCKYPLKVEGLLGMAKTC